jgi:HSP20 family protein
MQFVARIFLEQRDLDEDLRRLFDRLTNAEDRGAAAECTVPLDVVETPEGIEVVMDLAGVPADAVKVVVASDTLLVMGHKAPLGCGHHREAAFHIAERTFGRFARGVRLSGAFDIGHAQARLRAGELRITLPRVDERRGRERQIPVRTD